MNKVPFIYTPPDENIKGLSLDNGILADIAPTILNIMGIEQPGLMTGRSLLKKDGA